MKSFDIDDEKVKNKLDELEYQITKSYGNTSGAYAIAKIFNYDKEYFDIEVKSGIQSDCTNNRYVDNFKMNRETLKIEDA